MTSHQPQRGRLGVSSSLMIHVCTSEGVFKNYQFWRNQWHPGTSKSLPGQGSNQVATGLQDDSLESVQWGRRQSTRNVCETRERCGSKAANNDYHHHKSCPERFGAEEKRPAQTTYTMNQRAVKIHNIQHELNSLKKLHKEASEEQHPPLAELQDILRKRLMTLRRAERQPGLLEELDLHMQITHRDLNCQRDLGQCDILVDPPPPTKDFNNRETLLKEVKEIVRKARSSSAPGPSGVPYKVYKYCPLVLKWLWKILRLIWKWGKVA